METQEGGNLNQVRDILFGAQVREFSQSLSRLDERFSKEIAGLKKDMKERTDSLELYVKNELQSLMDRLGAEKEVRERASGELSKQINDLGQQLNNMTGALDQRLAKLDEKRSNSDRTLRQHIVEEAKSLRDDFVAKYEEQSEFLARETRLLRDAKTDRTALADLLQEMARRLTGESDVAPLQQKPK